MLPRLAPCHTNYRSLPIFREGGTWASFGPNATPVAAPAAHIACFRHMRSSPFRCGFPRAFTAHLPEDGTKARNRATRILFKKRVECGMRDPFLSGQDALRLTLHAKPQVTKYATWDFLSEYPFENM